MDDLANSSKRVLDRVVGGIRYQARSHVIGLMSSSGGNHPRFVIFTRGRSGSTMLVDLLNRLPEVHCDGELLHDRVFAPRLFVRCCQLLAPSNAHGFKLLTYQLSDVQRISDGGAFMGHLDRSGCRIIYLTRSNMLRQVLSSVYARHRGQWHHRNADGADEATRMTVNLEELHYRLRKGERLARYEKAALSGLDFLELVYERDLQSPEDQQRTVDRVAGYLGVRSGPVSTGFARMMNDDLAALISNYDEVVRFIEGTEYRRYLLSEGTPATQLDR